MVTQRERFGKIADQMFFGGILPLADARAPLRQILKEVDKSNDHSYDDSPIALQTARILVDKLDEFVTAYLNNIGRG